MHSRVSANKKGTAGLAVLTSRFSLRLCPYFSLHLPGCALIGLYDYHLPCCDLIFLRTYPAVPLSRFTINHLPCCAFIYFLRTILLCTYRGVTLFFFALSYPAAPLFIYLFLRTYSAVHSAVPLSRFSITAYLQGMERTQT